MLQPDIFLDPIIKNLTYEDRGLLLIHLLMSTAEHVAAECLDSAMLCLKRISHLASPDGDAIQRLATYFAKALTDRIQHSLHQEESSCSVTTSSVSTDIPVRKLFFHLCPFMKLAYIFTNQAIVEAMEDEKMVHIIDLNAVEPAQWIDLLQKLSQRPNGPPFLTITCINEQKEMLELIGRQLTEEAETLNVPFQFVPVVSKLDILDIASLQIMPGEAIAVSSVLQLHSLLTPSDEVLRQNLQRGSVQGIERQRTLREWLEVDLVDMNIASQNLAIAPPKIHNFLSSLRSLSPKLLVITEQETNNNRLALIERFKSAMTHYAILFDILEYTVPRSIERRKVEQALLGEEIKNIVAFEGIKRTERHEKLEKWNARLEFAGFKAVPLGVHSSLFAKKLLDSYGNRYKIKKEKGCYIICWDNYPLFSVSAWNSRGGT